MRNMNRPTRVAAVLGAGAAVALAGIAPPATHTAPEQSSAAAAAPARPANGWNYDVAPGETELVCSATPGETTDMYGKPGETRVAFTALDARGVLGVIARLRAKLTVDPPEVLRRDPLDTEWKFPPELPRLYSYGITDLPNLRTDRACMN